MYAQLTPTLIKIKQASEKSQNIFCCMAIEGNQNKRE